MESFGGGGGTDEDVNGDAAFKELDGGGGALASGCEGDEVGGLG